MKCGFCHYDGVHQCNGYTYRNSLFNFPDKMAPHRSVNIDLILIPAQRQWEWKKAFHRIHN